MNRVECPSPNFDERGGTPVDMLVLHYTGTKTAQEAMDILRDPTPGKRVSAHYLVDEDGTVFCMVPEDRRAWHAGVSSWRGNTDINARSIGIEIQNPGHEYGYRPFPPAQMQAVAELSKAIIERHGIPSWNVVAHSDIAPARKQDPGELFDWEGLAKQGIGTWPKQQSAPGLFADPVGWVRRVLQQGIAAFTPFAGTATDVVSMQKSLKEFGYDVPQNGQYDAQTKQVVEAFQRHWRPTRVNGLWDDECRQLLNGLLEKAPSVTVARPDGRTAALA